MTLPAFLTTREAITLGVLLAMILTLFIGKRIILVRLKSKARSENHSMAGIYRVLVLSLDAPLTLFIFLVMFILVRFILEWLEVINDRIGDVADMMIKAGLILTLFLFFERFFTFSLRRYQNESSLIKNSSGIASGAMRAILVCMAVLIILSTLGVSVTPIIASLGITSLAVALALQPTLENFFSGLQLVIDKPIRVGDFIELDSGEQGFVEKIGWRSTWVRMLPNNIVIMPNSKLSNSKLINYYYPARELSVPVDVGVHYSSDLDKVEKICVDVATYILHNHEFGVSSYQPFVLFHTFDNSSINLTVMLRSRE